MAGITCAECKNSKEEGCVCQDSALGVMVPKPGTLKKYGLTAEEYIELAKGGCSACGRPPATRPLAIDHEHVKGWAKMAPEERKKHVRGVLCYLDNRFLTVRGMTSERLTLAADYIRRYEERSGNVEVQS